MVSSSPTYPHSLRVWGSSIILQPTHCLAPWVASMADQRENCHLCSENPVIYGVFMFLKLLPFQTRLWNSVKIKLHNCYSHLPHTPILRVSSRATIKKTHSFVWHLGVALIVDQTDNYPSMSISYVIACLEVTLKSTHLNTISVPLY